MSAWPPRPFRKLGTSSRPGGKIMRTAVTCLGIGSCSYLVLLAPALVYDAAFDGLCDQSCPTRRCLCLSDTSPFSCVCFFLMTGIDFPRCYSICRVLQTILASKSSGALHFVAFAGRFCASKRHRNLDLVLTI